MGDRPMRFSTILRLISDTLMSQGDWVPKVILFGSATLVIFLVIQFITTIEKNIASRIRTITHGEMDEFTGESTKTLFADRNASKKLPTFVNAIIPKSEEEQTTLLKRLNFAGFYSPEAVMIYYLIKFSICLIPFLFAVIFMPIFGMSSLVVFATIVLAIFGLIGPSFFLDFLKGKRQYRLRRELPDAMDLMVVCVEGGMGIQAAVKKIAQELRLVHPDIAMEFTLVHLQTQMGMSVGKAIEGFGQRTDLEEIRQLAHVIVQSEKLGSSMAKTLKTSADSLRTRRQQQAESKAQKAAVKILIPTILFIFPAIFVVVLAPAMIQFGEVFAKLGK